MCGIVGAVWHDDTHRIEPELMRRMTDALTHRGPDEGTYFRDDHHRDAQGRSTGVAFGFRRLSIIDAAGSSQPLQSENGRIQVIFNGEIYNHASLRRRLEGRGHRFATSGDGEVIVHLYEDHGVDAFDHLNGMFAVAIWDGARGRLILARDRIGQKPLYYACNQGQIVFASELKSIVPVPHLANEVDPAAIDEYLTYGYVPPPGTIFKGVRKLPPGHRLVHHRGETSVQRYWNYDPTVQSDLTLAQSVEQTRSLLTDSVRLRLRSDVPLGTFLSGGIDSSIVTAIAQSHTDDPVATFSMGFPVADYDETGPAARVAEHLGTRHTRLEINPDDADIIDGLVEHFDEPFGDSSAIPTYHLCRQTRRDVTVALSGDGGDELFAGYERYHALHLSRLISRLVPLHRLPGASLVRRLPDSNRRRSLVRRGKRFLEAIGQSDVRRYLNWLQTFPESMRASIYRDDFVEQLPPSDPAEYLESVWARSAGRDLVTRASTSDVLSYLPEDLCVKVDRASMAHSLEVRQPMLDHRLVEFAATLPLAARYRGSWRGYQGKRVLRFAFADRLPPEVFSRKKMGFGVPISPWFRDRWRTRITDALNADAAIGRYFDMTVVGDYVDDHLNGVANHGYRLWNLWVLEAWLRRWT